MYGGTQFFHIARYSFRNPFWVGGGGGGGETLNQ